jgi:hypothetical protein
MFLKKILTVIVLTLVISVNCMMAESLSSRTVLVVPARYKVVQLAFDIVTLRNVNLVSYQKQELSDGLLLHAWNPMTGAWQEITPAELQDGVFNAVATAVIGDDANMFINYTAANTWGGAIKRLPTYNVADILNGLEKCYRFNAKEWTWLAKRYGISVKETNYELRRYGKYGPPGSEQSKPSVAPSSYRTSRSQSDSCESSTSTILDETEVIDIESVNIPEEKGVTSVEPVTRKEELRNTTSDRRDEATIKLNELLPEN